MTSWTSSAPALSFEMSGRGGMVLLLMHEIGGSRRSWDAVVSLLGDRFTLLRFDQRGFGCSEKPRAPYAAEALAKDAWRVVEAAGVRGPIGIVAAAAACTTAVAMARTAPSQIVGMVLCAPAPAAEATGRDAARARADLAEAKGMRAIVDPAMAAMYPQAIRDAAFNPYRARFLANDPVGFALANRAFAETEAALNDVATPMLLLAGTHDVRPLDSIAAMAARMPHASVSIVPDSGHIMAVQQPDAVALQIARFFINYPDFNDGSRRGTIAKKV